MMKWADIKRELKNLKFHNIIQLILYVVLVIIIFSVSIIAGFIAMFTGFYYVWKAYNM